MTGSLQTKNNKYYLVLNYRDDHNRDKRKWISTGLEVKNNKVKAQQMLKDYLENNRVLETSSNKENSSVVIESFMLFTDFLDEWLDLRKGQLSPLTWRSYWHIINKIKSYFKPKNTRLNELRPFSIEEYYKYMLGTGVVGNTVLHHHVVIRKALEYAYKNDLIGFNPADRIERPKKEKHYTDIYNKEELQALFKAFEGTSVEVPVYLAAFYGLRRSEVLGLKWSAVDFANKCIHIRHKVVSLYGQGDGATLLKSDTLKNDSSSRTLPLLPQVELLLKRVKERIELNKQFYGNSYSEDSKDYICTNAQGELMKPSYITDQFSKILKQNNLKHIRFHDLRHSCASMMLAEGVPMKQIQEWLGHATFSTTADIYSHLEYSSKIQSAKRIQNVYSFYNSAENDISQEENMTVRELMQKYGFDCFEELKRILEAAVNSN